MKKLLKLKRRTSKRLKFAVSVFLAFTVGIIISEAFSAWYINSYWTKGGGPREWHLTRPAPYQASTYWSPKLVEEQYSTTNTTDENGDAILKDFSGTYINIENGLRKTVNQPQHALHTIYLMGSSTTVNAEVPDNLTIASYLQSLVRTQEYKVVNMGVYTVTTRQAVQRLKHLQIKAGDIVIMYGGITDAISITQVAFNRRDLEMRNTLVGWLRDHFGRFMTVRLLTEGAYYLPREFTDEPYLLDEIKTMVNSYQDALNDANQYVEDHGGYFISILQPHLWSYPLSEEEQKAETYGYNIPQGFKLSITKSWPFLASVTDCDLTHILDDLRKSRIPLYFDHAHTNEIGNKQIAKGIFQCLDERTF